MKKFVTYKRDFVMQGRCLSNMATALVLAPANTFIVWPVEYYDYVKLPEKGTFWFDGAFVFRSDTGRQRVVKIDGVMETRGDALPREPIIRYFTAGIKYKYPNVIKGPVLKVNKLPLDNHLGNFGFKVENPNEDGFAEVSFTIHGLGEQEETYFGEAP